MRKREASEAQEEFASWRVSRYLGLSLPVHRLRTLSVFQHGESKGALSFPDHESSSFFGAIERRARTNTLRDANGTQLTVSRTSRHIQIGLLTFEGRDVQRGDIVARRESLLAAHRRECVLEPPRRLLRKLFTSTILCPCSRCCCPNEADCSSETLLRTTHGELVQATQTHAKRTERANGCKARATEQRQR